MKVLKYDRAKGSATTQSSRLSYVSSPGVNLADINQRIAMLESTVLRLSNEIEKGQSYLLKGGDRTSGAYTFGSVKADRFDTNSRVEVFENSDEGRGYIRINGFGNSTIPFVPKQGELNYIEVTPRLEVKGVASVEGEAFTIISATEGQQIKFKVGYNIPALKKDFTITLVRAYVGIPITPAVPSPSLAPSVGDGTGGDVVEYSHFWYECDVEYTSNIATFTVTGNMTDVECSVKVEIYYTFITNSELAMASIQAWYDGTEGNRTFKTADEPKLFTATQEKIELKANNERGYQLRADGLYKTTDGTNWEKVV